MFGLKQKAKKLKSKADQKIAEIRKLEETEETEIEDVEEKAETQPGQAQSEEEESLEREQNIVEEIRSAESDLESLLRLDEEELQDAFEYFADSIELEKKENQKIKTALENLREIDEEMQNILEEFSESFQQYRQNVVDQFRNQDIDVVVRKTNEVDPKDSDITAPGLQGMAAGFLSTELKRIESDMKPGENLVDFLRRQGKDDDKIVKMADWYNQVLWTLEGRSQAVEKPRYIDIKEELSEIVSIRDSAKQVVEEFESLREFENEIKNDIDAEMKNIPQDLKGIEAIGEDLVQLKKEIDRTELEEEELVKIEKNTSIRSHPGAHNQLRSEVENIESNLSNLENHIDKIAQEVADLEQKDEEFEKLDETEEEELKAVLDQEEGLKQLAERLKEEWVNETLVLFGEGGSKNYQSSGDIEIKKDVKSVLESIEKIAQAIDIEAMRLGKYSRKEYEDAEKFRYISKEWFTDLNQELQQAGLSIDKSSISASSNINPASAD